MTRQIGPTLNTHFQGETLTVAMLWKLTRRDETVMGFTNHDRDISYLGVDYVASTGFTPSEVALKKDLSVSNFDVQGMLDSEQITEADLIAGLYDFAEIEILMVNYNDLTQGHIILQRGHLGEVRIVKKQFVAEVRGLSQNVQQTVGELYTQTCRANLGDTRCKKDLAAFSFDVTITSLTSDQIFKSSDLAQAAGYFNYGLVTWTSGNNDGLSKEVKDFANTQVTLVEAMPYTIQIGDTFTIIAGCDKRFVTCTDKFDNVINFRGEPYVPGLDKLLETSGTV